MDAFTKSMLGTSIGVGSLAVAGESMKMLPKNMGGKGKPENLFKGTTKIMFGTAMLSGASSMI
jgi:hypothetical protein